MPRRRSIPMKEALEWFTLLRGTFATRLMVAGFTDQQVSLVMGWKLERIAGIRARYVDRGRVVRAMARGMRK